MSDNTILEKFLSISTKLTVTIAVCFVLYTGFEDKSSKVVLVAGLLFLYKPINSIPL